MTGYCGAKLWKQGSTTSGKGDEHAHGTELAYCAVHALHPQQNACNYLHTKHPIITRCSILLQQYLAALP